MVHLLGEIERLASSAMVRYAACVGSDAAGVLAGAAGQAKGQARRQLETAGALEAVPELRDAFCRGELSIDQAAIIAPVASIAPESAPDLVALAKESSLKELRAEAERTRRRATPEEEIQLRERQLHARRHCRTYCTGRGGLRLEAFLSGADAASLLSALDKETDALVLAHERAGIHEQRDRLRADALVALVSGTATATGRGAQVLVRVDAAALARGEVGDQEVCEVAGIGPVSVETARSLLGEGFVTLLVHKGEDITTVTSTTRFIPRKVRMALVERDRTCVVPGCPASENLEIDHWHTDFARSGPTALHNLCRLCALHHRMKTREGWRLAGGPGNWEWHPPRAGP